VAVVLPFLLAIMSAAPITFPGLGFSELNGLGRRRPSLLTQARRGNREAFAEMVSPHMATVYRRARRLTGNTADAEDVSQEALLKAWSRLGQFSGSEDEQTDDFRAWLARIAANASIDVLRQRRDGKILSLDERRSSDEETFGSAIPARGADPEEQCARRESARMLAEAIRQLPADLRQACLLRDVLQYSTQEVAERLGISLVAVRLRLFRAHRRLRETLDAAGRSDRGRTEKDIKRARATKDVVKPESRGEFLSLGAAEYACGD
jgi:RNA polymerase sigma-70 factor, ECF subfamily